MEGDKAATETKVSESKRVFMIPPPQSNPLLLASTITAGPVKCVNEDAVAKRCITDGDSYRPVPLKK